MTYAEALDYVASLSLRGWRLGLDRMEELVRRAGLNEELGRPKHFHIAGTNGKGSVTAYIQSILIAAGHPTGGFFSPYVYDIRERIQMSGEPISAADFVSLVEKMKPFAESLDATEYGGVTEFEFKTAMGLAYWRDREAECVALEVGLGGRLDATNVVIPAASAIVSIGLDHTAILGETHAAIAGEKAGVLKLSKPAVIGDLPSEARDVVRQVAAERDVPLWEFGREFGVDAEGRVFTPWRSLAIAPPIPGRHQLHNVAVAVATVERVFELSDEVYREGVSTTRIPGRFERRFIQEKLVILDGAHNAESMQAFAETLGVEFPAQKFAVVFGMLEGHDPGPVVQQIERIAAEVHLCPIDFRRTRQPEELASFFSVPTTRNPSSVAAFGRALEGEHPIAVTGSFYLVGEVGRSLPLL